jgi:hypothetical protein
MACCRSGRVAGLFLGCAPPSGAILQPFSGPRGRQILALGGDSRVRGLASLLSLQTNADPRGDH